MERNNPRQPKKKNGKGTTKNYYHKNDKGDWESISPKEFKEKMQNYKNKLKEKNNKTTQQNSKIHTKKKYFFINKNLAYKKNLHITDFTIYMQIVII